MRKAKIMLGAIAILAVTGGALAIKAKTLRGPIFCTDNPTDACSIVRQGFTLTGVVPIIPVTYCTDQEHSDLACSLVVTFIEGR